MVAFSGVLGIQKEVVEGPAVPGGIFPPSQMGLMGLQEGEKLQQWAGYR